MHYHLRNILIAFIIFLGANTVSAHISITDGSTISCGSLDSTDLTTHTTNQIESRITQTTPTDGISLYSNRDFSFASTTAPWTRNSNAWTQKGVALDFTGIAGYNLYSSGTGIAPNRLATLISPRHFLAAAQSNRENCDRYTKYYRYRY